MLCAAATVRMGTHARAHTHTRTHTQITRAHHTVVLYEKGGVYLDAKTCGTASLTGAMPLP